RDRARLEGLGRLLASLDPRALLSRGYAMVRGEGGAMVTTAASARSAGHLRLQFADGEVPVAVTDARPARKPPPPQKGQGELF
ncbi:MAG: exodeoxyribonuclease VII large subunit, partial [Alphaproteobacteria bacterium HGW-Alphaproteobacteria-13]